MKPPQIPLGPPQQNCSALRGVLNHHPWSNVSSFLVSFSHLESIEWRLSAPGLFAGLNVLRRTKFALVFLQASFRQTSTKVRSSSGFEVFNDAHTMFIVFKHVRCCSQQCLQRWAPFSGSIAQQVHSLVTSKKTRLLCQHFRGTLSYPC